MRNWLLLLDTGQRSGLPAGDFAPLVVISKHTLYAWKKRFDTPGPAGLLDRPNRGPQTSHLPDLTKRNPQEQQLLHWRRPGAVWARDCTEVSQPIDDCFPYVFAVRDVHGDEDQAR